ncbi:MAG: GerMN domain-containing protein [Acidimicrobiales bacterium]
MTANGWRRAAPVVVVALAVVAGLGGCGLPTDDEPRSLAADDIPDSLLAPSSTTTPESLGPYDANLWWIDNDVLVDRPANLPDLQPSTVISALLEGVPPTDVQTSIPGGTELLAAPEDGGILTVDLSEAIATVQGEELKRALAQIVWTATQFPNISRVRFQVNGEPLAVITDEGTVTDPVNRGDFLSLQPPEPAPTTTTGP